MKKYATRVINNYVTKYFDTEKMYSRFFDSLI